MLTFGHRRALLTRRGVHSIADQAFHSFSGLPAFGELDPIVLRATLDGFWLVLISPESFDEHDLWSVDFTGAATYVGRYASRPSENAGSNLYELASDSALFDVGYDVDSEQLMERRTLTETQIVYSERDDPLVKRRRRIGRTKPSR